jgi:hypothetical protein
MKEMARRLGKLEQRQMGGIQPRTIFVHFSDKDDSSLMYAWDHAGVRLQREPGESVEAFKERASAYFHPSNPIGVIYMSSHA